MLPVCLYFFETSIRVIHSHSAIFLRNSLLHLQTNALTSTVEASKDRSRLLIGIAQAIRMRVPSFFILGIKINSVEFQHGRFDAMECRELCANLETDHFDFFQLTEAYQKPAFMHRRESTRRVKEKAFSSNSPRLLLLRRRLLSQAGSNPLAQWSIQLRPSMALP